MSTRQRPLRLFGTHGLLGHCLLGHCLLAIVIGCSSNRSALARGQGYYEDNQYERALAVWRDLERHEDALRPTEFARYAYLRGMTDYRLGLHADARHWLSLAKISEHQQPGSLASPWQARLDAALDDLNREVFGVREVGSDPVQSIEAPGPATAPATAPRTAPATTPPSAPSGAAPAAAPERPPSVPRPSPPP